GSLQQAIDDVRRYLGNPGLRIAGLLLTRTRNDNVSRDVEGQLRGAFGDLVFKTTIPTSVKVEEAHGRFLPVIDFAPRSPGARASGLSGTGRGDPQRWPNDGTGWRPCPRGC